MSRRGDGMSERVLWLRLCVTGPTPECGEIVGLRIVDRQGASHGVRRVLPPRQGRRLEERAGRRGEREPGEPSAVEHLRGWDRTDPIPVRRCCAASMWNATSVSCAPPASVSRTRSWRVASWSNGIRDLRRGLPSPRAPGTRFAGPSRWDEQTIPYPKQTHPPPICSEKREPGMPTLQARAAHGGHSGSTPLGDRGSDVVNEPIRVVTGRGGRARCRTRARHRTARRP